MLLTEKLCEMDPDEIVYLGSKSSFMYIGTASEVAYKLNDINDEYFDMYSETLERQTHHINTILARMNHAENILQIEPELTDIRNTYEQIFRTKEIISNWVPLREREVKDCYPRASVEPFGTIIIVKGPENGKYWLKEEMGKAPVEDPEGDMDGRS